VQGLDPAGVGARNLRECLLLQLESRNGRGGVAWKIVSDHLKLVETRDYRELSKVLGRPPEHIEIAIAAIRRLNRENGRCNFEQTTRNGTADKSRAQE